MLGFVDSVYNLTSMNRQDGGSSPSPEVRSAHQKNLVVRVAEGDATAETELVHLFTPRIFMMGMVRIGEREAVRDLVQEVLISVICALRKQQLLDSEKLAAFVAGTARNLINNYLRKKTRRPREETLSWDLEQVVIDAELVETEQTRVLEQALRELDEDDRQLVNMILTDGLKPRQIAARLGLTAEVVRSRKLRAVRRLANLVREMSRS